ncbi:hypothetical protein GH733_002963 [Mirounga leonina]|nr:hypothetical protein GH733_002963 [Mirounga leonina]
MTWTLSLLILAACGPVQVLHQGLVGSVKNPFEQDDWEAWVKFTAGAECKLLQTNGRGVGGCHHSGATKDAFIANLVAEYCPGLLKTVYLESQNWAEHKQLVRTRVAGSKAQDAQCQQEAQKFSPRRL